MEGNDMRTIFDQMHFIEQFVESVVDYTSRYNNSLSVLYSPDNIIGKPTKYPCYGDFPETYMLRSYGTWWKSSEGAQKEYRPQDVERIESEDYIVVKFEQPVLATKIVIYETFNPGAIVRIWGGRGSGNWALLWQGLEKPSAPKARLFSPPLKITRELIHLIRIEFNQSLLAYHTSIDAILLAGYKAKSLLQANFIFNGLLDTPRAASQKKHSRQSYETAETCSLSNFLSLPHEVIVYIFGYLDLKSLCKCALVNRAFQAASSDNLLYRQLSFKRYWHRVSNQTLQHFEPRCTSLRKLDLSWCGNDNIISEAVFIRFLHNCGRHLTHLSLSKCGFVKFKSLEVISQCRELQDLRLQHCCANRPDCFLVLAELVNLRSLDLNCSNIDDQSLIKILKSNSRLRHLNIDLCELLSEMDLIAETLGSNNKKLRSFSCWKTHSLTAEGIKYLSKCTELRELDLGWCLVLNDPADCLVHIAQGCLQLERLVICGWRGLSEHQLLPIIRNCNKIKQLDLLGSRNITSDICDRALRTFHDLQLLDISFCDGLNEKQVALWRAEFPHVAIQRSCEYVM